jgi:hypothetical protein
MVEGEVNQMRLESRDKQVVALKRKGIATIAGNGGSTSRNRIKRGGTTPSQQVGVADGPRLVNSAYTCLFCHFQVVSCTTPSVVLDPFATQSMILWRSNHQRPVLATLAMQCASLHN